jgi:hypothetical protein
LRAPVLARVWEPSARVRLFLPSRVVPHIEGIFPCWSRSVPSFRNQTLVKMEPLRSISIHPTNQTDPNWS